MTYRSSTLNDEPDARVCVRVYLFAPTDLILLGDDMIVEHT
jgi:hypothetical protein